MNLIGGQENTYVLTGTVMTEEEYQERIAERGDVNDDA
jgi:hypothetical protein